MPSHKDGRVYRIAGIPSAINGKAAVRGFLADFFDSDEARITIRSLGIHPQKPDFLVAIVGFSPTPTECSSGSFWRLEKTTHVGERSIIAHLEIDTEFLGFTPLNLPLDDDQCDKIDCIAVSGLSSHPFGSWKHRGGQFMWLVDDTDGFPLNVRVLLYGYDSTLFGSKSFQDIEHMGQRLATQIAGIRPLAGSSPSHVPRPLVFIAHSLGGLVVKEAVYQMANDDAADAQTIFGLVLFGVPHFGLLVEPWLDIIGGQPNRTLIEDLSSNSRVLRKLDSRWPDSVSHTQIPMNRSHEDLPKFSGQFDSDYLVLKPFLEEIWVKAVQVVQARLDAINSKPQEMATESVGLIQLWPYKEMGETVKTEIEYAFRSLFPFLPFIQLHH
ncbi:hypothetical protein F5144DRAFT_479119 [Chaetomium tenue]|uniref:Uncharacterized protein n=1 Tax=Chaetomium tenue TaxID=1854479 RepID=A0ACB7PU28_9PEZI|nr:hypothetical protein F5144DRAFT_479119 [Chaetomium globosum]